jgi:TrmH family RNA methyltransferase
MQGEVSSLQNPKIKAALKLNDRRTRNESGLFLIEGYRELKRAVSGNVSIPTLFFCPQLFLGSNEEALIAEIRDTGADLISCHPHVFEKLSYRDRPDGLLGIGVQMRSTLLDLDRKIESNPFLIIAEAIEKPGNLGTILRSSDAAGVDGVIVCDRCTDIYNPNVVRASVGTLFTVPVIEAGGIEALNWLRAKGISIVAASPSAKLEFTEADLTGPVAIAVGTEQIGLSQAWMDAADIQVRIPMHGVADSLNVATATTLLLYEVLRQRAQRLGSVSWK